MKLETAKSFALVVLVGVSLLLTFGLWTYQPNQTPVGGPGLLKEIDIGGMKETKKSLIEPINVIFHTNGSHFGYDEPEKRQGFYNELQSTVLYDFRAGEKKGDIQPYDIEMVYPDDLPMEILPYLFSFKDDIEEFPTWSFDRMYFTFMEESSSLKIQFISLENTHKATAVINDSQIYSKLWKTIDSQKNLTEYLVFKEGKRDIFFPSGSPDVKKWSLSVSSIPATKLVNDLFLDPSSVSRSIASSITEGEVYFTDSLRELSVDHNGNRMEFFNPITSQYQQKTPLELLDSSIEKINGHKGWTEEFNLMNIEPSINKITYQMFYKGYPVFNKYNMASISQEFRNQDLYRYQRSLFKLNNSLGKESVYIPSGEAVLKEIEGLDNQRKRNILDIKLGYELKYQENDLSDYVTLEPTWYVNYNGAWEQINTTGNNKVEGGS